ncbi:hypothetical protein OBBRIDRAFT_877072, partial [Obba rivulosa]
PLGFGEPLWRPGPTKAGEAEIGDVGFIWEGSFFRLFNSTRPADNKGLGVPQGYELLVVSDAVISEERNIIFPDPLRVRFTQMISSGMLETLGAASSPGSIAGFSFECNHDEGAFLVLLDPATHKYLLCGARMAKYMRRNFKSWSPYVLTL